MSWPTLRAAVDVLLSSSASEVELAFLGGEPLLEFDLLRRAVLHARSHARHGQRLRASVQTNGTLVTDEVAEFLASEGVETQLSFDGVRRAQERRHPDTFDLLDRLLDRLRERRPEFLRDGLSVALTLTPCNLSDLAASLAYFADKGVRRVAVTPLATPSPAWRLRDIEELDLQLSLIEERARRLGEHGGSSPLAQTAGRRPDGSDRVMCGVLADGPTVDIDGSLVACGAFAGSVKGRATGLMKEAAEVARMGRPVDGDLDRARFETRRALGGLAAFAHMERKRSGYRACASCPHLEECFVCPAAIARSGDDPHRVPDIWCAWNQVSLARPAAFATPTSRGRVRGEAYAAARARWRSVAPTGRFVYNGASEDPEVQPSRPPAHGERPPER